MYKSRSKEKAEKYAEKADNRASKVESELSKANEVLRPFLPYIKDKQHAGKD